MSIKIKPLILFAFLILGLNFTVKADEAVKKYDYKDFNSVEAGYGMHVKIIQSNSYSIEVKADERDFKYFKAEKSGRKIEFYIDKNNFRKRGEIYITINMPELTELTLSGGSMGDIAMNTSKKFEASLSGGASLNGNLKCADADFSLSGGSKITLSGKGKELKLDGSGGSIFRLKEFAATGADIDLSGGSDAAVTVNGKLRTSQSGGARVTYSGNTIVEKTSLSGGAKVVKEN